MMSGAAFSTPAVRCCGNSHFPKFVLIEIARGILNKTDTELFELIYSAKRY